VYAIDQEKCLKDGECVEACPTMAIEKKDNGTFKVGDDCTDCGACEPVCDSEAIQRVQ
jgi:NAD-dependent dihydropyrimidine dehydrogenase PreA subunit